MAIAPRPAGVAGPADPPPSVPSPADPPPGGRAPHRLAVGVAVTGLALTATLAVDALAAYHRAESRLLSLQTRLVVAAAQAEPLYVEDHLGGAARLARPPMAM